MFRDFLRATPEVAAAYAALKQQLARQFRHDLQHYWVAKGPFIQSAAPGCSLGRRGGLDARSLRCLVESPPKFFQAARRERHVKEFLQACGVV